MFLELTAATARGAYLVALSETLAGADLAELRRAHVLAAPIPASRGGLGVTSVRDLTAAVGRLARADARTAMRAEGDLVAALMTVRAWRRAVRAGDGDRCAALEREMRRIAREGGSADAVPDDGAGAALEGTIASALLDASIALGIAEAAARDGEPFQRRDLARARVRLARAAARFDDLAPDGDAARLHELHADAERASAFAGLVAARALEACAGRRRRPQAR